MVIVVGYQAAPLAPAIKPMIVEKFPGVNVSSNFLLGLTRWVLGGVGSVGCKGVGTILNNLHLLSVMDSSVYPYQPFCYQ